jgi:hypothetical protein
MFRSVSSVNPWPPPSRQPEIRSAGHVALCDTPVNRGHVEQASAQAAAGNPAQDWVISTRMAHPTLVSEADFVAVQAIRAVRPGADGTVRSYLLAGLLR